jgi:hypothetical protein
MARDILCQKCAPEFVEACERYSESYRIVTGRARNDLLCDRCVPAARIARHDLCSAATSYPGGHGMVLPWEGEFLADIQEWKK